MAVTTRDGKTQTALAEINMIPFIDIMLVLLIIFMITAPVIQSGLEVNVPETEEVRELTEQTLVVTIDHRQELYLQDRLVNIKDIGPQVMEMLPSLKRPSVFLRADKEVTWEISTTVIDALKNAGVENIVIVTRPLERRR